MKRLLLLLMAVVLAASVMAESVSVFLSNGKQIKGTLITYNEEILIIEPNTLVKYEKRFLPEEVIYFSIEGVGICDSKDGKFIFDESTRIIPEEATSAPVADTLQYVTQPANPNEVIGKALKTTGNICMGIGVPALVAGTILVAVGNTSGSFTWDATERANAALFRGKLATAGYVLMPFGAALTIVGIPLHVHGKRIGELHVNYTGNGAGLSLSF